MRNLFDIRESDTSEEEVFEAILRTGEILMERIISTGQATPPGEWYDQALDEWVLLLSGAARLRYESGEVFDLRAGDYLLIPAHCRHRVEFTTTDPPAIWLAVHANLTNS